MGKSKVLIIEDDPDIVEMIEYNLKQSGYQVISSSNGQEGISLAAKERPDLIILDLMLPVVDGFEVCRTLRGQDTTSGIPIIILSAKSHETDKVLGLELGADDYMTKPFSPRELLARIKAVLRRGQEPKLSTKIDVGIVSIDPDKHRVKVGGKEVALTSTEFKLVEFLARRPGFVFSRNQILDGIFGDNSFVFDRTVDAHIKSLRRKLGKAKDHIETVRGSGYRFKDV
jgi:two-component system alkaline phosphatase synthesis response regulator PhoP